MDYFLAAFKKYAVFSGRARRKEYWFFILVYVFLDIGAFWLDASNGHVMGRGGYGPATGVLALIFFLPGLGVAIRRLHDTGRSGWWFLINFVPLLGWLITLFFMVQPSQPGTNEYGPNPITD